MGGIERRYLPVEAGEVRAAAGDDGKRTISGYAAVFDTLSVEMWGFREKIAPGAFAETLANGDDVRALFNHDANIVLGRTRSGTLRLAEDEVGLACEIDAPETHAGRDVVAVIERGDVTQMSFGFVVLEDSWHIDENEQYIRTLRKVKLYDVSPVVYPAYPDTSVGVRELPGNRFDPAYGQVPEIPADLRRAPQGGAEAEAARARRAKRLRELDLASASNN